MSADALASDGECDEAVTKGTNNTGDTMWFREFDPPWELARFSGACDDAFPGVGRGERGLTKVKSIMRSLAVDSAGGGARDGFVGHGQGHIVQFSPSDGVVRVGSGGAATRLVFADDGGANVDLSGNACKVSDGGSSSVGGGSSGGYVTMFNPPASLKTAITFHHQRDLPSVSRVQRQLCLYHESQQEEMGLLVTSIASWPQRPQRSGSSRSSGADGSDDVGDDFSWNHTLITANSRVRYDMAQEHIWDFLDVSHLIVPCGKVSAHNTRHIIIGPSSRLANSQLPGLQGGKPAAARRDDLAACGNGNEKGLRWNGSDVSDCCDDDGKKEKQRGSGKSLFFCPCFVCGPASTACRHFEGELIECFNEAEEEAERQLGGPMDGWIVTVRDNVGRRMGGPQAARECGATQSCLRAGLSARQRAVKCSDDGQREASVEKVSGEFREVVVVYDSNSPNMVKPFFYPATGKQAQVDNPRSPGGFDDGKALVDDPKNLNASLYSHIIYGDDKFQNCHPDRIGFNELVDNLASDAGLPRWKGRLIFGALYHPTAEPYTSWANLLNRVWALESSEIDALRDAGFYLGHLRCLDGESEHPLVAKYLGRLGPNLFPTKVNEECSYHFGGTVRPWTDGEIAKMNQLHVEPLVYACMRNDKCHVSDWLLDNGMGQFPVDTFFFPFNAGRHILHLIAASPFDGCEESLELLVSHRLLGSIFQKYINMADMHGSGITPLMVAIQHAKPRMVGKLLDFGADPARSNALGQTALDLACDYGLPLLVPEEGFIQTPGPNPLILNSLKYMLQNEPDSLPQIFHRRLAVIRRLVDHDCCLEWVAAQRRLRAETSGSKDAYLRFQTRVEYMSAAWQGTAEAVVLDGLFRQIRAFRFSPADLTRDERENKHATLCNALESAARRLARRRQGMCKVTSALVVGIDRYDQCFELGDLKHACKDALDMKTCLESLGVQVAAPVLDAAATRDGITEAIVTFADGLSEDETCVVFFACHGIMSGRGTSNILPSDASFSLHQEPVSTGGSGGGGGAVPVTSVCSPHVFFENRCLSVDSMMRIIVDGHPRRNCLFVLDCCREAVGSVERELSDLSQKWAKYFESMRQHSTLSSAKEAKSVEQYCSVEGGHRHQDVDVAKGNNALTQGDKVRGFDCVTGDPRHHVMGDLGLTSMDSTTAAGKRQHADMPRRRAVGDQWHHSEVIDVEAPPQAGCGFLMSCAWHQLTLDGCNLNPPVENGLFTSRLLLALKQPGLTLDEIFKIVQSEVASAAGKIGHRQFPVKSDTFACPLFFNDR